MANTTNTDRLGILVVAVVLLGLVALFGSGFGLMDGGHVWDGGMWGTGVGVGVPGWLLLVGVVMQLLFSFVLVGATVFLFRALGDRDEGGDEALEALRLVYARGELSEEEYDQRRGRL